MKNQLEILSEPLQNIITRKYPDYSGDRTLINIVEDISLPIPEFGIFDTVKLVFIPTSVTFMFDKKNLQLSHLHFVIKMVNHLSSFFGLDDYDNGAFRYKDLEPVQDDEEEYIESITRFWESSFDNNCTCTLDISFQDNSAFFVITFDMT